MKNLTILYPTDFSELSLQTLKQIIPFLSPGNNHLRLVHAANRKKKSVNSDKAEVKENFEKFIANCPGLKEIDYTTHWEFALSRDLILRESDKVDTDIIIMPTKGAKGLNRLWGSKTEAVVRDAIVPVIVLPDGAKLEKIQRIVLAVDFDELSCDHRLMPLMIIADQMKTEIDVLTVNKEEHQFSRREKINRKHLKYRLHRLPHRFSTHFEENVGEGLVNYAKKNNAELIAIMPRDYNFLEGLFRESLSQKMVLDSPIPLLILK